MPANEEEKQSQVIMRESVGFWQDGFRRLRKNKVAMVSLFVIIVVMIFSFIMAIGIFMLLPMFISNICKKVIPSHTVMAILEGFIRIAIIVIYIKMVSRMEDIKRTFMYHCSEHKCINCVENGKPLTVENVLESSRFHRRCGTSFLFLVLIVIFARADVSSV